MAKKEGKLLAYGLIGISLWAVSRISGVFPGLGMGLGLAGAVSVIITEAVFLWRTNQW